MAMTMADVAPPGIRDVTHALAGRPTYVQARSALMALLM
jgi:hypothetical protein